MFQRRIQTTVTHQRSSAPLAVLLVQCAIMGFALVGVVEICLFGSQGIARRNTLVKVTLPSATEFTRGMDKEYTVYIIIGWPLKFASGEPLIQLEDQFAQLNEIGLYLSSMNDRYYGLWHPRPTIVIYADKKVPMAMIKAVKHELQLHDFKKVRYAVTPVSWRCWPGPKCLPS